MYRFTLFLGGYGLISHSINLRWYHIDTTESKTVKDCKICFCNTFYHVNVFVHALEIELHRQSYTVKIVITNPLDFSG